MLTIQYSQASGYRIQETDAHDNHVQFVKLNRRNVVKAMQDNRILPEASHFMTKAQLLRNWRYVQIAD